MSTKTTTTKTSKARKIVQKTVEPTVVVPEPVTEEVVATETPVATEAPVDTEAQVELDTMKQRFERLIKSRQDHINELKREIAEIRKMQRDHEHAIKDASKKSKKKKALREDSTPRKPSGFASPVTVSDDLYTFLERFGVTRGEPIARTDVTRHITQYIKENDLQNPEHRREIVPDATLKKLFGEPMELKDPNDTNSPMVYTYLKLQRYLSSHFPKKN